MLIFTPEGPRTIDERNVRAVYRGGSDRRYTFATLVMGDGTEVAGAVAKGALARLEGNLADMLPPAA
jgi:hypothetical protein